MPDFLYWPTDSADSKPATCFEPEFIAFFDEMSESGVVVQTDCMCFFGFTRGSRCIEFIRRGHSSLVDGRTLHSRDHYWQVLPIIDGVLQPLGLIFGLGDHACVVTSGLANIRSITTRWLAGVALVASMRGITFMDQSGGSSSLVIV